MVINPFAPSLSMLVIMHTQVHRTRMEGRASKLRDLYCKKKLTASGKVVFIMKLMPVWCLSFSRPNCTSLLYILEVKGETQVFCISFRREGVDKPVTFLLWEMILTTQIVPKLTTSVFIRILLPCHSARMAGTALPPPMSLQKAAVQEKGFSFLLSCKLQ